jgi:hypothetical protein
MVNGVEANTFVRTDSLLQVDITGRALEGPISLAISNGSTMSSVWSVAIVDPALITTTVTPPTSFGLAAGAGIITVSAAPNVFWRASSGSSWASVNVSMTGNSGSVSYTVSPNTGRAPRHGLINIGGLSIPLFQSAMRRNVGQLTSD